MKTNAETRATLEEIKTSYYGRTVSCRRSSASPTELTPSAKYIAAETKKRIGQRQAFSTAKTPDEEQLLKLVQMVETAEGEDLSAVERTAVVASLSASLEHYDLLTPLVQNPEINDIIVRSYRDISIQIGRRNIKTDLAFPDQNSYLSFIENLLKRAGKACTLATPVVDAAIDPSVRACVTHESFSPAGSGPMLTLRIARHGAISLDGLALYELAPRAVLEYLGALVRSSAATVLVAGEVGTGKTTLIKALAGTIDEEEAILVIEDTHEIALERPFVRTLLTREANTEGTGRIAPAQAIRTGMRMAMNRIILGEMRDAEAAEAFIDVCASGHAGMSTIHARSARDALSRLELFLLRAQGNIGVETVRRQIANAVSAVVYLGLDKEEKKRRILNLVEVGTASDGAVQISPIFSYHAELPRPYWLREGGLSLHQELLQEMRQTLPEPGARLTICGEL